MQASSKLILRGKPAYSPAQVALKMSRETRVLIAEMFADMRDTLRKLPWADMQPVEIRQLVEIGDAAPLQFVDMATLAFDDLTRRWTAIFSNDGENIAGAMSLGALKANDNAIPKTMANIGKAISLEPSEVLKAKIAASSAEAAALIKRVPSENIQQIQGDVMRSITQGEGLKDLLPALREREVKVKNWAHNVALDQTRKVYGTINRTRMQEVGVKKFEWVHSGGSNEPRKHHMMRFPAGLNGGIFSYDNPPIIDPRTGERGFPSQAPFCGCIERPIVEIED